MREIKYRAWNGKEMFNVDVLAISPCAWDCPDYGKRGVSLAYQPSISVMQHTGLKDTNDIEIYEEDIISTHKHDFVVKWDEIGGMYLFHEINNPDSGMDYYEFEENYSYYGFHVIGNVYKNPELLEDK